MIWTERLLISIALEQKKISLYFSVESIYFGIDERSFPNINGSFITNTQWGRYRQASQSERANERVVYVTALTTCIFIGYGRVKSNRTIHFTVENVKYCSITIVYNDFAIVYSVHMQKLWKTERDRVITAPLRVFCIQCECAFACGFFIRCNRTIYDTRAKKKKENPIHQFEMLANSERKIFSKRTLLAHKCGEKATEESPKQKMNVER